MRKVRFYDLPRTATQGGIPSTSLRTKASYAGQSRKSASLKA